jgi:type II secretory pathway predicted ATPase ExeA
MAEQNSVLINPFTPRSRPLILEGRAVEISRISQHLSPLLANGTQSPSVLAMCGPRGVGKTSLLRLAQEQAEAAGLVTAWVSCAKSGSLIDEIRSAVLPALEKAGSKHGKWGVDGVSVSANLPFVSAGMQVSKSSDDKDEPLSVARLEGFLREAADAAKNECGKNKIGLVLFIDEFQAALKKDLAFFLNALQNITNDLEKIPLSVIVAGLPSLPGMMTKAATFGERSHFVNLTSLTPEAAAAAITKTAQIRDIRVAQSAAEYIAQKSAGYPFFVQLFGYYTWDEFSLSQSSVINLDYAERGVSKAQNDVRMLFAARWDAAASGERAFLIAMAEVGGEKPSRRSDIAAYLGKESHSLSQTRSRLIDKAVITDANPGWLQFTLPGFADFVKEQE